MRNLKTIFEIKCQFIIVKFILFIFFRMNGTEINPWDVHKLEEFLYFCCPECDEKNQSKDLFIQHALDEHPKAKHGFGILSIKEESIEEENLNNKLDNDHNSHLYYGVPERDIENLDVKYKVKQESNEDLKSFNVQEEEFQCEFCEKSFQHEPILSKHVKIDHGTLNDDQVHKCGAGQRQLNFFFHQNILASNKKLFFILPQLGYNPLIFLFMN